MKKITTFIRLSIFVILVACSRVNTPADTQQSIEFRATIAGSASISEVKYILDGKETSFNGLNGITWTSGKLNITASAHKASIVVNGSNTNGAMLTIQIFIDGQLKKEEISSVESLQGRISASCAL